MDPLIQLYKMGLPVDDRSQRVCAGGEEARYMPFLELHQMGATVGRHTTGRGVDMLAERRRGMGPLLEIHRLGAPVDVKGHRGCPEGVEAWHGPIVELYQMGLPIDGWERCGCAGRGAASDGSLLEVYQMGSPAFGWGGSGVLAKWRRGMGP